MLGNLPALAFKADEKQRNQFHWAEKKNSNLSALQRSFVNRDGNHYDFNSTTTLTNTAYQSSILTVLLSIIYEEIRREKKKLEQMPPAAVEVDEGGFKWVIL